MNGIVSKTIKGSRVIARPIFRGGRLPAYWACIVNDRTLDRTFPNATAVFRFFETVRHG